MINTLIIIHELGHYISAKILGIETSKIVIYPLGGITKFNMDLNTKSIIEFIILISGPLSQNIGYFILINIFKNNIELINTYHIGILLFNLLPIYPLDGGKLLNIILNQFIPFKKSLKLSINISYIFLIILFIYQYNIKINIIITLILLIILIKKEEKEIVYKNNKFKLERILNNYNFKKNKIITNIDYLYKDNWHIIREKGQYFEEKDYLLKKYEKN